MICCFCERHVDERDQAIDEGWIPSFWHDLTNAEYEGPVCPACQGKHIRVGANGEPELWPDVSPPPLAIPLKRHPNLG